MGVEEIPGHVHQAGDKQPVPIEPGEHLGTASLVNVGDGERVGEQFVFVNLEQLIARIGRQRLGQNLAVKAAGIKIGSLDHVRHLAADHRNVNRVFEIYARGVKAEKSALADHVTRIINLFVADIVRVSWSVHAGQRARFRKH